MKKLSTRTKIIALVLLTMPVAYALNNKGSSNGCVDVTFGSVHLSVPQRQPITSFGNFTFVFDSNVKGVDCPVGCDDLFVNISSTSPTLEKSWIFMEPKFTGRLSGSYRVYFDRFTDVSKPTREILVPLDAVRPQDEYYVCTPEGRVVNPTCNIRVVAKSGLVAEFSIPRKVLSKAREAASFVTQSIDQFSENHTKGICK